MFYVPTLKGLCVTSNLSLFCKHCVCLIDALQRLYGTQRQHPLSCLYSYTLLLLCS